MTDSPTAKERVSAGDPIPPKCAVIEVHVGELKQLFDAIDPSPFRDRDLDPKAEEFIVGWAKDFPKDATLALVVDLDREAGLPDEATILRESIHEFFKHRAERFRQRLRELVRVGRTSLVIGLVTLAAAIALGDFLATLLKSSRIGEIVRESLTIGGWVSMWRPLEVFLYDWWPVRNEARLSRLHTAQHRIHMVSSIPFRAPQQCINLSSRHGQRMPARPTVLSVGAARELFRAVPPEPTSSFSGSSAECRTRLLWPWHPPSPELLNRDDLQDSKTSWQSSQSLWVSSSFLKPQAASISSNFRIFQPRKA